MEALLQFNAQFIGAIEQKVQLHPYQIEMLETMFAEHMEIPFDENCSIFIIPTPNDKPVKIVYESAPLDTDAPLKELFEEYQRSPCFECSMIASMHDHIPGTEFKYNCSEEKSNICRQLYSMERCGAPGAQGWDSSNAPSKAELARMAAQDKIENDNYWNEYNRLKVLFQQTK